MIKFNLPPRVDTEEQYLTQAIESNKICGNGNFTKRCQNWLEEKSEAQKVLLTTSGSTALDMAMLLCGLEKGDEVILPSFTFCSTANAAVLAGAKLVFVDVRPDTMNIDEKKIAQAITPRTKVIVVVHYAGVACEMDTIMALARNHNLLVVEDAAQGVMSDYKGKALGTIGDLGCYSFHETKNFSMGEGGALLINNNRYAERVEILWEKGTNRNQFLTGKVDKYFWLDYGGAYTPSELNAAYLWAQLEQADKIYNKRMLLWNRYNEALQPLEKTGKVSLQVVPEWCRHNGLTFWLKLTNEEERQKFISFMKENGAEVASHYPPLHSAPGGKKFGIFSGKDEYTTKESERLVRLPLYYSLSEKDQSTVITLTKQFFS